MHKKGKIFSYILLMLILLLNLSGFLHTVCHIQIRPEVFCTAQHDRNSVPHLEDDDLQQVKLVHCSICEFQMQNNGFEYEEKFFTLMFQKRQFESFCVTNCNSVKIFHTSSRAPPAA